MSCRSGSRGGHCAPACRCAPSDGSPTHPSVPARATTQSLRRRRVLEYQVWIALQATSCLPEHQMTNYELRMVRLNNRGLSFVIRNSSFVIFFILYLLFVIRHFLYRSGVCAL